MLMLSQCSGLNEISEYGTEDNSLDYAQAVEQC